MNHRTCSFPICERRATARDLCEAHAKQRRAGQELKPLRKRRAGTFKSLEEVLNTHTVFGPGCWDWTSAHDRNGYPLGRLHGKRFMAYRGWYELTVGAVPAGMQVDHICHNRGCVNPDHLRLLTIKQNAEHRKGANANSKTGVRGVYWSEGSQRYIGYVEHNGKCAMNKRFKTIEEAEAAVIAKRLEVFTHSDTDRVKA